MGELLANYNEISIADEEILAHEATTAEVKECCKDLRVLGRKELKLLINWRKRLIKHFEDKTKKKGEEEGERGDAEAGIKDVEMKDGEEEEEEEKEEEDDLDAAIKATVE